MGRGLVAGFLPDQFTPPLGILVQGSPYLEQGPTYDVAAVRFQLVLIAGNGTNETVTTSLDQLIEQALDLINDSDDFFVEEVDQTALYKHGQGTYLSCVISVRTAQRLGGQVTFTRLKAAKLRLTIRGTRYWAEAASARLSQ